MITLSPDFRTEEVNIVRLDTVQTASGPEVTEVTVETVFALIKPLSASAKALFQKLEANVDYSVEFEGVKSYNFRNYRFDWNGRRLRPSGQAMRPGLQHITAIAVEDVTDREEEG